MKRILFILACLFFAWMPLAAEIENNSMNEKGTMESIKKEVTDEMGDYKRDHPLTANYLPDIRISGNNGIALFRFTEDAFIHFIAPHLKGVFGHVIGTGWNMATVYLFTLWPHEFGHWMRAEEIGIKFKFHNYMPFFPHTTIEIPEGRVLTNEEAALVSVAGFEVNTYIKKSIAQELYSNGYGYSGDLSLAMVNSLFMPIYSFLVIPRNPEDPEVWRLTAGDPVHSILPVYKRYTGREPIGRNGVVDPELVKLYHTTTILSAVMPLTDPLLYMGILEDIKRKDSRKMRRINPFILLGDRQLGYTYGTNFNPSPLGYEIYFINYIFINKKLIDLFLKLGGPMLNQSIAVCLPNILDIYNFSFGPRIEIWNQSDTGVGGVLSAKIGYSFFEGKAKVWVEPGYKTKGYSLGLPIKDGFHMIFGLTISFAPNAKYVDHL